MSKETFNSLQITVNQQYTYVNLTEEEKALLEIEFTAYFVGAINWFIDTMNEIGEEVRLNSNPKLPEHWEFEFRTHTQNLIRIATAFTEQIPTYTGKVRNRKKLENLAFEHPEILDLSKLPENLNINSAEGLADLLSKVLNHPLIPDELKMSVGNGITDLGGNSESLNKFADSPEVIVEYLQNYVTGGGE